MRAVALLLLAAAAAAAATTTTATPAVGTLHAGNLRDVLDGRGHVLALLLGGAACPGQVAALAAAEAAAAAFAPEVSVRTARVDHLPGNVTLLREAEALDEALAGGWASVAGSPRARPWPLGVDAAELAASPCVFRLFLKPVPDRKCLSAVPRPRMRSESLPLAGVWLECAATEGPLACVSAKVNRFVNRLTGLHRRVQGGLDTLGQWRQEALAGLAAAEGGECERVDASSLGADEFFRAFVAPARPVIVTGAADLWPALRKWSPDYLRRRAGHRSVHVKIGEEGNFEGVEAAARWPEDGAPVPEHVRRALVVDDLVVVRPADMSARLGEVLDLVRDGKSNNFYLEYLALSSLPELEADTSALEFAANLRHGMAPNLWLGGATRGRLHFDEYDNFMTLVRGRKRFTVFDPSDNRRLYEGHIREGKLAFDRLTGAFERRELHDSTAIVMSPVDLDSPDPGRFPLFGNASRLVCDVGPGETLFLPAWWWHDVESTPDRDTGLTIGVNTWFDPLYAKEFPCAECERDLNPSYADTVRRLFGLENEK